ncbi:MAG: hypothetical protein R2827_11590 [Bdellovibrionales bacterium]
MYYSLDSGGQIQPRMDDAQWMARRISQLDRSDWVSVVEAAHYPPEVHQIMVEKLICRRNWMVQQFLPEEFTPIDYELDQTSSSGLLKNGILTKSTKSIGDSSQAEFEDWWDGYGSRFSFGPDESPISVSEIFAFARSRVYSQALYNLIDEANRQIDISSRDQNREDAFKNQQRVAEEQFKEFLETGKFSKPKFSTWTTNTYTGNLLLSRDIVIGSFLGTDNLVQLADTIGVSADAGVFYGVNGGPDDTLIGGNARGTYLTRYTHLKPVASIKAALKEPIKNMLVPLTIRSAANELEKLTDPDREESLYWQLDSRLSETDEFKKEKATKQDIATLGQCSTEDILNYNELLRARELVSLNTEKVRLELELSKFNFGDIFDPEAPWQELQHQLDQVNKQIEVARINQYPLLSEEECLQLVQQSIDQIGALERATELARKNVFEKLQNVPALNIMNLFKESLNVGESFIITQGIGGSLGVSANYSIDTNNSLLAQFETGINDLSRLHIHRKDEETIQIYKSGALFDRFGLVLGFRAFHFPVFTLAPRWQNALDFDDQNQTRFFEIKLSDRYDDLEYFKSIAPALLQMLRSQDLEMLEDSQPAVIVDHNWKDRQTNISVLLWRWLNQSTFDEISITDERQTPLNQDAVETNSRVEPVYPSAQYFRRSIGTRSGRNYEEMGVDVLNAVLAENDVNDIAIQNIGGGNPGDSFLGNSYFKRTAFEGRIRGENIDDQFIEIAFRWKGWQLDSGKTQALIEELNEKFAWDSTLAKEISDSNPNVESLLSMINETDFYNPDLLHSFDSLKLYRVDVNIYIYDAGVDSLLGIPNANSTETIIPDEELAAFVLEHGEFTSRQNQRKRSQIARRFVSLRKNYRKYLDKDDLDKATKQVAKLGQLAEQILPLPALVRLVGGKNNIYIRSTINGFRSGAEDAEQPLFSNSLGRFGSLQRQGPIQAVQSILGMSESEFYFYWLLGQF